MGDRGRGRGPPPPLPPDLDYDSHDGLLRHLAAERAAAPNGQKKAFYQQYLRLFPLCSTRHPGGGFTTQYQESTFESRCVSLVSDERASEPR